MDLEIGKTFGDYQIVGILGAGGMGKVYKVRNTISDRVEAMKVLLPDLVAQPELADRFLREIKVQASLEHPNIAALHTALRVENQLVMLMEFVEGVTLEQRMKDSPIPEQKAVDYIMQVLSALEYAHQRGVIHRDIKPANMMLTPAGAVKLMDFGIAKAATDQRLTMTGTTMGSLYYMSPEQIQGASNLDSRADLYSVGVSLYELVTGKRPFDGDSQFAIMSAHLEKMPVPPIALDPRLPQALNDIILLSVAKDPNARFQGAGAFRNALGNIASLGVVPQAAALSAANPGPAAAFAPQPPPNNVRMMDPMLPVKSSGRRGLWMAIGALAAAAAVIGAIEFGPWKGAKASLDDTQQTAQKNQVPVPIQSQPQQVQSSSTREAPSHTAAETASMQPLASVPQLPKQTQQIPQPAQSQQVQSGSTREDVSHTNDSRPIQTAALNSNARKQMMTQGSGQGLQQAPIQQPQGPPPAPPAPLPQEQTAVVQQPNRAELQTLREDLVKLNARVSSINSTLQGMERSQAAMGVGLSSRFTGPRDLMTSYIQGARDALNASDTPAAKDFTVKAERQVEILEKLLNK